MTFRARVRARLAKIAEDEASGKTGADLMPKGSDATTGSDGVIIPARRSRRGVWVGVGVGIGVAAVAAGVVITVIAVISSKSAFQRELEDRSEGAEVIDLTGP